MFLWSLEIINIFFSPFSDNSAHLTGSQAGSVRDLVKLELNQNKMDSPKPVTEPVLFPVQHTPKLSTACFKWNAERTSEKNAGQRHLRAQNCIVWHLQCHANQKGAEKHLASVFISKRSAND